MTAVCRLLLLVPGLALASDPVAEHYIIRRGPGPQATTFLSAEKRPRSGAGEAEDGGVVRSVEDMGKLLGGSVTIRSPASVTEAALLVSLGLLSLYTLGHILAFVLSIGNKLAEDRSTSHASLNSGILVCEFYYEQLPTTDYRKQFVAADLVFSGQFFRMLTSHSELYCRTVLNPLPRLLCQPRPSVGPQQGAQGSLWPL